MNPSTKFGKEGSTIRKKIFLFNIPNVKKLEKQGRGMKNIFEKTLEDLKLNLGDKINTNTISITGLKTLQRFFNSSIGMKATKS